MSFQETLLPTEENSQTRIFHSENILNVQNTKTRTEYKKMHSVNLKIIRMRWKKLVHLKESQRLKC